MHGSDDEAASVWEGLTEPQRRDIMRARVDEWTRLRTGMNLLFAGLVRHERNYGDWYWPTDLGKRVAAYGRTKAKSNP